MGCDVFYRCASADREPVERLVAIIRRWAVENELPYQRVDIRDCALQEALPWPKPGDPDENAYLRQCRERVHLYGIFIDFFPWGGKECYAPIGGRAVSRPDAALLGEVLHHENEEIQTPSGYRMRVFPIAEEDLRTKVDVYSRGQFLFDFGSRGRLVRCAIEPEYQQSSHRSVPCFLIESGGYWRSTGDYHALPRFLTCCKIRYLPELEFSSDYGEDDHWMRLLYEEERIREEIAILSEEEFYEAWVRKRGVIG